MRLKALETRIMRELFDWALRRVLEWFALAIVAWSLGTLAFIFLSPPPWASTGLALAILSLLPAFLLWPPRKGLLLSSLRAADKDTVLEAWLEMGEDRPDANPAAGLLERLAKERDASLPFLPRKRARAFKGLGSLAGFALLSFALLQLGALLVLKSPALSWKGPRVPAGSGLAAEEKAIRSAPEPEAPAPKGPDEKATRDEKGQSPGLVARRAEKEAKLDLAPLVATGKSGSTNGPSGTSAPIDASPPAPKGGPEEDSMSHNLSTASPGDAGAKGEAPRGQGYSASRGALPASPLVNYRARIFQALTASGGRNLAAGEGLSDGSNLDLSRLRDYERLFFSSFTLTSGSLPRDDAWASQLKRRWRDSAEGGK